MKRTRYLLPFLLLTAPAMAQKLPSAFEAWRGKWKSEVNKKVVYEQWSADEQGFMKGDSWRISPEGDSTYFEKLRLFSEEGVVYYEPTVPSEHNNGIRFKMIRSSENEWVFYHPENEYPKYIHYRLVDATHIDATVYNEEEDKLVFRFEKVK